MLDRRPALALPAAVLATALAHGCGAVGIREPQVPVAPIASEQSGEARPARAFIIVFMTFIPGNAILGPRIHPQSYCGLAPPSRLAFAGDDRGFDPDATSYRAKQVVTVIPDEADDPDGLLEGSKRNLGGITESFVAAHALADGRIDDRDRDPVLGDRVLKQGEAAAETGGMIIEDPVRLGPHRVAIRLRTAIAGGPRNELVVGAPSIDWDIRITIDTSGPEPVYEVAGTWDGYPAAELYINRQPVFTSTPGDGPGTPGDLLRLVPGYADFRFVGRGTLGRPRPR